MAEHADFWKGLVTGTLVGMAFAIYSKADFERLFRSASPTESSAVEPDQTLREHTQGLHLRREAS
ncbi:MAG TPA: hypothetical protein VK729_09145 [Silvibacterium sp.]|jgi:hypothetical protein|nr:hypothetical protein [Silvibacterium sp.]